jgi:hypothetical protein
LESSCQPNSQGEFFIYFASGTSASAPSFAGIMALVDQQMGGRQGLPNYMLYRLAATQSAYPSQCNGSNTSTAPATACIFNDVTVGNNVVPGETGTQYQASTGYDQATGLGSVNIGNLINAWNTVTFNPTTTTLTLNGGNAVNVTHGQSVPFQSTVAPNSGTGTPTGGLVLFAGLSNAFGAYPSSMETFQLTGGQVFASSSALPGGSYNIFAHYSGDGTYAPSDSGLAPVTVNPENSTITETLLAYNQAGNPIPVTSVPFGSFVYLRADVQGVSGQGIPTGSVTFSDTFGAIPGGNSFPLNSQGNTANPTGVAFDSGTHTLSASYSGDVSFNPSSTTQSQSVVVTPGFSASVPSASSQVLISAPGMSGNTSVTVSTSSGFRGTINLSCSQLPSEAACVFAQASVTGNGTAAQTSVGIQVTTQAPATALRSRARSFFLAQWISGAGLIFSMVLVGLPKQRRRRGLFVLLLLGLIVVAPGCGGGSHGPPPNPGTPTGTYTVTVNAVSGSTTNSSSFTLVVQ